MANKLMSKIRFGASGESFEIADDKARKDIAGLEEKIDNIETGDVDLTNYYTKTQIDSKGYLTQHQDISNLALKSEIPDVSGKADKTEIPSLTNYYTKSQVDTAISNASIGGGSDVDLTNYYTKEQIDNKGYLTSHQDISNLVTKSEVPTKTSQLTNDSNFATTSQLFSGDYNDLTNKPTLFSGSYNDLTDKPDLSNIGGGSTELKYNTLTINKTDIDLSPYPTIPENILSKFTDWVIIKYLGDYVIFGNSDGNKITINNNDGKINIFNVDSEGNRVNGKAYLYYNGWVLENTYSSMNRNVEILANYSDIYKSTVDATSATGHTNLTIYQKSQVGVELNSVSELQKNEFIYFNTSNLESEASNFTFNNKTGIGTLEPNHFYKAICINENDVAVVKEY